MNINISDHAWGEFWNEVPDGSLEFWAFRSKPQCQVGETICFYHHKELVATAMVAQIEPPGLRSCEQTGRFKNSWKVFWVPESFRDERITKVHLGFYGLPGRMRICDRTRIRSIFSSAPIPQDRQV